MWIWGQPASPRGGCRAARRARLAPVGGWLGAGRAAQGGAARHPPATAVAGRGGQLGRPGGRTPGRLDSYLAGAARWRAMRAMPLAHCVICAAGRYAVPFAVWSTMGEARKASRPCGSMK